MATWAGKTVLGSILYIKSCRIEIEGERLLVACIQPPHPLKQNRGENPPDFVWGDRWGGCTQTMTIYKWQDIQYN